MPKDTKPKGGMSAGFLPVVPVTGNSQSVPVIQKGTTNYDTLPSMLYFIKAVQDGNNEAAGLALKHVNDVRGAQTATNLVALSRQMGQSSIHNIAKRSVAGENDPQMKQLYAMINENPDVINHFQMAMPERGGLANSLTGL